MKSQAHIELKKFDDELRLKYGRYIAGIDECGRGSLAGPLVAACVVLDDRQVLEGIKEYQQKVKLILPDVNERVFIHIRRGDYVGKQTIHFLFM